MRKLNFFLALGLLMAISANAANEVYSIVQDGNTLVFFYNGNRESYDESQHPTLYDPSNKPGERFAGYNTSITRIHLDESMKDATFTSLLYFFGGSVPAKSLYNVTEITHLDYLNTAGCTSMSYMFNGMKKLASVDVSKFNTSSVQYMASMFRDCQKITSIDLQSFNTAKVMYMSYMFYGCNTATTINVSTFNTAKVVDMNSMFQNCAAIKRLNLSSFDMQKVTEATYMFGSCMSLETILCSENWSNILISADSENMFYGCSKLVGGKGTAFDSSKLDKTYARPDCGTDAPGYFTGEKKVYTEFVEANKTLTYYCDDLYPARKGIVEIYNPKNSTSRFNGYSDQVLSIDIDASMADTSLTNMTRFFSSGNNSFLLKNATSIKHLENLITTKTENMDWIFYGLNALKSLDISYFDTQNTTNMAHMFVDCYELERLRLGDNFNTAKVTSFREMFNGCQALKAIDCSHMNVDKVKDMCRLFSSNLALVTIWCNEDWSEKTNVLDWGEAFNSCTSIKGAKGTVYDNDNIKNQYARPDEGTEKPGYFTPTSVLQNIKDEINASLDALKSGASTEVDQIIASAKSEVNSFVWDLTMTYDENEAAFDAEFTYDWFMQVKTKVTNQYAIEAEKEKLNAAIVDLSTMKTFASDYLGDNDLATEINNYIIAAQVVYDNPNATLAEVQTAVKNANDAIANFKEEMLPKAKAGFKAGLNGLLQPGDNQQCKDIVAAAVAQVDVLIVWDDTKNATQNIVNLVQIAQKLYNDTKAAVEAARTSTNFDAVQQSAIRNQKVIRNGQLLIIRDGKTFNAAGVEL